MKIYTDYGLDSYLNSTGTDIATTLGGLMVLFVITMLVALAISIISIISLYKIFKKFGRPGWYAIIPILNAWVFFEIADIKGWLSLIPIVNGVYMFIVLYKIAIKSGKSVAFAVLTIFFSVICLPIIAFSKSNEQNLTV